MASEKRLIDANAFEETHCKDCPYRLEGSCTKDDPICSTIEDLRDAPTVDAVEVVHGRTEVIEPFEVTLTVRCCLCGAAMGNLDNYCPNCGAKMDGDGNG